MSYLLISTYDYTMSIAQELKKEDKDNCEQGYIHIVDLELKQFYVENDTWQKIPER